MFKENDKTAIDSNILALYGHFSWITCSFLEWVTQQQDINIWATRHVKRDNVSDYQHECYLAHFFLLHIHTHHRFWIKNPCQASFSYNFQSHVDMHHASYNKWEPLFNPQVSELKVSQWEVNSCQCENEYTYSIEKSCLTTFEKADIRRRLDDICKRKTLKT